MRFPWSPGEAIFGALAPSRLLNPFLKFRMVPLENGRNERERERGRALKMLYFVLFEIDFPSSLAVRLS